MTRLLAKLLLPVLLAISMGVQAAPLGIRTNNPGNITASEIKWVGEIPCPKPGRNECFISPYHGMRALAVLLHTYIHKHGLTNIEQIMSRYSEEAWAPKSISQISGIPLDAPINTWDKDVMLRLMHSIVVQENGFNPYQLDFIGDVLDDTYGADHFVSINSFGRYPKAVGKEDGQRKGSARHDVAGVRSPVGGASADQGEYQRALPVDTAFYSCICRALDHSPAEGDGNLDAGYGGNSWLDGDHWGVLAADRRGEEAGLARSSGVGDHPSGYALGISYCRSVLWRITSWAPVIKQAINCKRFHHT